MKINNKEYVTMSEMVIKSGKTANAIKQWLHNHNIRPLSREALYEVSVLEALLKANPVGRPVKTKDAPKKEAPKKSRKK